MSVVEADSSGVAHLSGSVGCGVSFNLNSEGSGAITNRRLYDRTVMNGADSAEDVAATVPVCGHDLGSVTGAFVGRATDANIVLSATSLSKTGIYCRRHVDTE